MLLVSDNFLYLFLKYKKKLEEAIQKQNERGSNTKNFLEILCDICDNEKMQKNKYDVGISELTKNNIKLLRRFNLKGVLMEISINDDRNNEAIFNLTLLIMEEIIQEFLQYLEFATIEGLGDSIKDKDFISRKEFENRLKNEIITNKSSTRYLDEFKRKKYTHS